MSLSCNLHDNCALVVCFYRACTQRFWAGVIPTQDLHDPGIWCGLVRSSLDLLKDRIFIRSGRRPSSAIWAIELIRRSRCCDRVISPIAMCAIVLIRRSRFTRSCCFADRDLRDRAIFSWSRVRTPAEQYDLFYWSWVRFPGQIACFRPVWFMAYVTRPHKWWIRVMGKKKPHGRKKTCDVTTLSVRLCGEGDWA